jgi:peroxiredoxin Q/BCP
MPKPWFVYLLECRDGSLYTGVAVDVAKRFASHRAGKGARYTRSHPPRRLHAVIACADRSQALRREHAIKRLPVAAKQALGREFPPARLLPESVTLGAPSRRPMPASRITFEEFRMRKPGDAAPAFTLASDTGHIIDSAALKGQRYVLYFYPKDDTPACTKEACAFRDHLPAFSKLSVPVFGVSADDERAHSRFVGKYGLNFPLLSDPDHELIAAYGVWIEKSLYGRKYMGIARSTFVIGGNGRIEQAWDKVKPETHAAEVLDYLRGKTPAAVAKKATRTAMKVPTGKAVAKKTNSARPAAAAKKTAARKKTSKR